MKTAAILSKLKQFYQPICTLFLVAACLAVISCGGGSGGDGFRGAGDISISVQPSSIDVGDRILVTATISNINEDGVIVKFEYPEQLSYVLNSSFLTVNGKETDIGPSFNVTVDGVTYLVYFFAEADLGNDNSGTLSFQIRGDNETTDESLRVDIDVDDPLIDNADEFVAESPEFQSVAEVSIKVST